MRHIFKALAVRQGRKLTGSKRSIPGKSSGSGVRSLFASQQHEAARGENSFCSDKGTVNVLRGIHPPAKHAVHYNHVKEFWWESRMEVAQILGHVPIRSARTGLAAGSMSDVQNSTGAPAERFGIRARVPTHPDKQNSPRLGSASAGRNRLAKIHPGPTAGRPPRQGLPSTRSRLQGWRAAPSPIVDQSSLQCDEALLATLGISPAPLRPRALARLRLRAYTALRAPKRRRRMNHAETLTSRQFL
jgi:hypothetical protein